MKKSHLTSIKTPCRLGKVLCLMLGLCAVIPPPAQAGVYDSRYRKEEYNAHQKTLTEDMRAGEEAYLKARAQRSLDVQRVVVRKQSKVPSKNYKKAISPEGRVNRQLIENAKEKAEKAEKGHRLFISLGMLAVLGAVAWGARFLTREVDN